LGACGAPTHRIDDLESVLLRAVLRHAANQSPLLLRPSTI
jgi:hypothetical protein